VDPVLLKAPRLTDRRLYQVLIAVVLIAAASVVAHMHVVLQSYHPVTRIASPEGLVFTAVQDAKKERRDCGIANERFLEPIKAQCRGCKVVIARCERELEAFERSVYEGEALAHHQVFATGLRLAIDGPPELARTSCELMAGELLKRGVRSAQCLPPREARVSGKS
jgi:hypothetical protein